MHHNFLFDLDQTLLDFHASEYKALGIVLEANGLSFSDDIYQAFKAYNKSLWLELEKGTISRPELFTKRFQYIFEQCEGDSSALDPLKINDDFIKTMSENGVLMDGALEFIQKLKENVPDARIYIASNGATLNAKGRIASTGLDKYIDYLFISEDMGVAKPDAAFFDICLDRIAEPKSSCIMIGDSLSSDMQGAKNAFIDSVWFMPSGYIEQSMKEYSIKYAASSFDELYLILKKWSDDKNYICKDQDGNILISVDNMNEDILSIDPLFTHCLAVVKVGDEYLLGRNKWRNRFEIFGGCVEKGESARECIVRECNEELGFDITDITYLGAMKILLKPDYFSKEERIELGGLYGVSLPEKDIESLYDMIKDKDEITQLALYSDIKGKEPIALIDKTLLEYYR